MFLTVALGASGTAGADRVTTAPPDANGRTTVKVQRGENAIAIARKHGITVKALCAANGLANPDRLFAGQALVIPTATPVLVVADLAAPAATPVSAPKRAEEKLASSVADLGTLAAAPSPKGAVVVRAAPLKARPPIDAARFERFGVTRTISPSARRGGMEVVGPLRD